VAINILWLLFVISWIAAAAWSNKTAKRLGIGSEIGCRLLLIAGVVLLFLPAWRLHRYPLWFLSRAQMWVLFLLMLGGLGLCWYARIHLGRLWSGTITAKADHRLIDTGPYAIVRHPIYTGLIMAFLATMLAKGTLSSVAGTVLVTFSFYIKANLEEKWLRNELGTGIYDSYRRRVPMLLPFGPKG
jgi:protein-S-isoprenylcysteine O-methyltransferase Ste14